MTESHMQKTNEFIKISEFINEFSETAKTKINTTNQLYFYRLAMNNPK